METFNEEYGLWISDRDVKIYEREEAKGRLKQSWGHEGLKIKWYPMTREGELRFFERIVRGLIKWKE